MAKHQLSRAQKGYKRSKTFKGFAIALATSCAIESAGLLIPGAQRLTWAQTTSILDSILPGSSSPKPGGSLNQFLNLPGSTPSNVCTPANGGAPFCNSQGSSIASQPSSAPAPGAGNPIDLITGNKYQLETDLPALPGPLGIELVRHYNSAYAREGTVTGAIGRGWRLSYETRAVIGERAVQILQADGRRIIFHRDAKQPSLCTATDPANGHLETSKDSIIWHWLDGRQLHFNPTGKLALIRLLSGHELHLEYDSQQRLVRIQDPQNRELHFEYSNRAGGDPTRIVGVKTPLGLVSYFSGSGPLASTLTKVNGGVHQESRVYHYEDTRQSNHLTGISVGATRLTTYLYDLEGRAVLSTKGRPAQLATDPQGKPLQPARLAQGTGLEQVVLEFKKRATPTQVGETVLTNGLGQKTVYRHKVIAGQYRILQAEGSGCASCESVNFKYDYDEAGRLTHIRSLNNRQKLVFKYDALGRISERHQSATLPSGEIVQLSEKAQYDGGSDRISAVSKPSVVTGREHRLAFEYNLHGQLTRWQETGWSPHPVAELSRAGQLKYKKFAGKSVLIESAGSQLTWNSTGDQISAIAQPGGRKTELTYDELGRVAQVRNEVGDAASYEFNAQGNLARIALSRAGSKITQIQQLKYSSLGNAIESDLSTKTNEVAPQWLQGFDLAGNRLFRATALGIVQQSQFDAESRLVASGDYTNTMARQHNVAPRNQLGRLAVPAPADAQRWFDDFGRLVREQSRQHGESTRIYDEQDRLIQMRDAMGNHATYRYDEQGRITMQAVSSGQTKENGFGPRITTWHYKGRQLKAIVSENQNEFFRYDARGYLTGREVHIHRSGRDSLVALTRYQHNDQGELLAETLADGSWLHYGRNSQGQVVSVSRSFVQRPTLRKVAAEQIIADQFERDLVGPRSWRSGNGVTTEWVRSKSGHLAKLIHRPSQAASQLNLQVKTITPTLLGSSTQNTLELILGIRPAIASAHSASSDLFREHRYLWSSHGLLLRTETTEQETKAPSATHFAYDRFGQLVVAVKSQANSELTHVSSSAPHEQAVWRYAYDDRQRRVLSQRTNSQAESSSEATSHPPPSIARNPNGQLTSQGKISYQWDSLGRMIQAQSEHGIGNYQYDHRGLRNTREVQTSNGKTTSHYLYRADRELAAEIDHSGKIKRQYIWIGSIPIALLDLRHSVQLTRQSASETIEQLLERDESHADQSVSLLTDLYAVAVSWANALVATLGSPPFDLSFIHVNHLTAPELVTNSSGQLVWKANYAPFGLAEITSSNDFTLNLRFPGQVFDAETGLHYNRQRYYDPNEGTYLSPDPLGHPDGPNAFAYAANNPITNIDPDGLVLFAFDGTENTDETEWLSDPSRNSSLSNIVRLRNAYGSGGFNYVSGVGTIHRDVKWGDINVPPLDRALNSSGPERILRMMTYFYEEAAAVKDSENLEIDIIGFSRGAAQARDFSNELASMTDSQGLLKYDAAVKNSLTGQTIRFKGQQCVKFRFMGLFDTVLSQNNSGRSYQLGIPNSFAHVAHAVALNEYRATEALSASAYSSRNPLPDSNHWGGFPLVSIGASSNAPGRTRIEMGFIGAHADIGGGYSESDNQLSFVALNWMAAQAQKAGIIIRQEKIQSLPSIDPVIHDQSNSIWVGDPIKKPLFSMPTGGRGTSRLVRVEDRAVIGGLGGGTQRSQTFNNSSMTNATTHQFIRYSTDSPGALRTQSLEYIRNLRQSTGTVDMSSYLQWLRANSYCFLGEQCSAP